MRENYYLGLDIGTDSCGWAITDSKYNILRAKGKDLWGVRLFESAETAQKRRLKRTNRRRRERAKLRIQWLNEIFAPEINKIDKNFLMRLRYSNLFKEDKIEMSNHQINSDNSLFDGLLCGEVFNDKSFYDKYPTIYHLRQDLLNHPAEDVRFLYLAILSIVKNRGHFLFEGDVTQNGQLGKIYSELRMLLADLSSNEELLKPIKLIENISEKDESEIVKVNKKNKSKNERKSKYEELFKADKFSKQITDCFVNGLFNVGKFFVIEEGKDCKLDFSEEGFELQTKLEDSGVFLSDDAVHVIELIKEIYSILLIKNILGEHNFICQSKVESFEKHKKDLDQFKNDFMKIYYSKKYFEMFRSEKLSKKTNYALYVNHDSYGGEKKVLGILNNDRTKESFYKYVKDVLESEPSIIDEKYKELKNQFIIDMENSNFLPKQRVKENGVLPNQLYIAELRQIIETNKSKYPFIAEKCKISENAKEDYKLIEIVKFRVPYYIGPITTKSNSKNAWAKIENAELRLKPWTIEKIVNYDTSEDDFIKKMLNHCTYIKDADVLPKNSILYSKFKLLNELNNLMIDGKKPIVKVKQKIFNELFASEQSGKVGINALVSYLKQLDKEYSSITTSSISGIDKGFANNFTSYVKLIKRFGKTFVDNNLAIFEEIILWNTLITDKARLEKRIQKKYGEIFKDSQQIKYLKGLNYSGWGKLSKEFLTMPFVDIQSKDNLGNPKKTSIIDELWNTNYNLQEILFNSRYTIQEELNNQKDKYKQDLLYEDVEELYCSPSVKRGVWQTLKIIKEVSDIMGRVPEKIFVEVTRHDETKGDKGRKYSRKKTLLDKFEKAVNEAKIDIQYLKEQIEQKDEAELRKDKLYLYFLQLGKCAYTGEPIDLEKLATEYDIDHIIPQSILKDDSIDNKVLVKKTYNNEKSDTYPINGHFSWITPERISFWKLLKDKDLMSEKKYKNLTRVEELSEQELSGFIARQLVETNQSVKAVIDLLKEYMPNQTSVVSSKAGFVSAFRDKFEIYKSRSINDLHHAKDAYLNIVVGNVLYSRFTENPSNFYKPKSEDLKNKYKEKNKNLTKNIMKLFDCETIYSPTTGDVVWNGICAEDRKRIEDSHLETRDYYEQSNMCNRDGNRIKKIALKNSPLVTRMGFVKYNGAYYKETIHKNEKHNIKTEASIALKGNKNNALSDVKKYGGYNSLNNAYFMIIQSEDDKVKNRLLKKYKTMDNFINNVKPQEYQKITIESVPIIVYQQYKNEPDADDLIMNWVALENGLINPKIIVPKLKIQSIFQIGKGYYALGGKTGNNYILHNFNQCFVDNNEMRYIKNIDKFIEFNRLKKLKELLNMNNVNTEEELMSLQGNVVISEASKNGNKQLYFSKEKNEYLYNMLVEKLNNAIYNKSSFATLYDNLVNSYKIFVSLSTLNQVIILNEIIGRISTGAKLANLSEIKLSSNAGMLTLSRDITNKDMILVEQSVTGLFEKRTKLKVR